MGRGVVNPPKNQTRSHDREKNWCKQFKLNGFMEKKNNDDVDNELKR